MELINTSTWIVLADAATAKIYSWHHEKKALHLEATLDHPEGREHLGDFLDNNTGHYKAGEARGAYAPHSDLKDDENTHFGIQLAHVLEEGLNHHKFNELIIIAEPHFYGLLEKHLSEQVKKNISKHIMKDYLHLDEKELHDKIFQ